MEIEIGTPSLGQQPQDDGTAWQDDPRIARLNAYINYLAVLEEPHTVLIEKYCAELLSYGVPLLRFHLTVNAVHPDYGGLGINWRRDTGIEQQEFEHQQEAPTNWLESPFFHILDQRLESWRERLNAPGHVSRYPLLRELAQEGATDYIATAMAYGKVDFVDPSGLRDHGEGALTSWASDGPDGFSDADVALLRATFPGLCIALRVISHRQTAENLLGVYLGRDAGKRVLSGEIQRGSTRWINAVICYFDLEGFTNMSQQVPGEQLIEMLNEYFGLVVSRIEENGGNVLKFMGDGFFAIFPTDATNTPEAQIAAAIAAVRAGKEALRSAEISP